MKRKSGNASVQEKKCRGKIERFVATGKKIRCNNRKEKKRKEQQYITAIEDAPVCNAPRHWEDYLREAIADQSWVEHLAWNQEFEQWY